MPRYPFTRPGYLGDEPTVPFTNVPYWCWDSIPFRDQYAAVCWQKANRCADYLRSGALPPGECQLCATGQQTPEDCHMRVLNQCTEMAVADMCPWDNPPGTQPAQPPAPIVQPPTPANMPPIQIIEPPPAPAPVWPWLLAGAAVLGALGVAALAVTSKPKPNPTFRGVYMVPMSRLRATQATVDRERVERMAAFMQNGWDTSVIPPIEVIEHSGEAHIHNGHHRAEAARLAGLTQVPAVNYMALSGSEKAAMTRAAKNFRKLYMDQQAQRNPAHRQVQPGQRWMAKRWVGGKPEIPSGDVLLVSEVAGDVVRGQLLSEQILVAKVGVSLPGHPKQVEVPVSLLLSDFRALRPDPRFSMTSFVDRTVDEINDTRSSQSRTQRHRGAVLWNARSELAAQGFVGREIAQVLKDIEELAELQRNAE